MGLKYYIMYYTFSQAALGESDPCGVAIAKSAGFRFLVSGVREPMR
jgi:hypothetical protein